MLPQMVKYNKKLISSELGKKHTVCVYMSATGINYKNRLTAALALVFNRKFAVCAATGGWLGIGRWPSAMPTIAVMWVSVPKTWMGIPVVFPVATKREPEQQEIAEIWDNLCVNGHHPLVNTGTLSCSDLTSEYIQYNEIITHHRLT